jgi:CRISPR/Cas system CSM-associated protein Csm2 small subunit
VRKQSPQTDETVFQTSLLDNLAQKLTEVKARRVDLQNRVELMQLSTASSFAESWQQKLTPTRDAPSEVDPGASIGLDEQYVVLDLLAGVALTGLPDIAQLSQSLDELESRQMLLAQTYSQDHPDVRVVEAQISTCRDKLSVLAKQAAKALNREIAAAEAHENRLVEVYDNELEKAKAHDDFLVWERQELDGIERLKTIYNSIVAQLNDWRLVDPEEDGVWETKIAVLEPPSTGSGPIWPKASLLLSLYGAIGLLGGLAFAMVLERDVWTNRFSRGSNQHVSRPNG